MKKIIKETVKQILYYVRYGYKLFLSPKVEKTVVILGMHRSGTSLTAGILNMVGVHLGNILQGSDAFNKKGHFENQVIKQLNKEILREAGGSWDNPPSAQEILAQKDKFAFKIKRILKLEQKRVWGWKDPRTSLTIELFLPYLNNPCFIVCRRDIDEVALSLHKRNGFAIEKGRKLAKYYNAQIDYFLNKHQYPTLEINFVDYFKRPEQVIDKILKFLDLKIGKRQQEKILHFIDPTIITSSKFKIN